VPDARGERRGQDAHARQYTRMLFVAGKDAPRVGERAAMPAHPKGRRTMSMRRGAIRSPRASKHAMLVCAKGVE